MKPPDYRPRQRGFRALRQARFEAETQSKLEPLASGLHAMRAAILRFVERCRDSALATLGE